MVKVIYPIPVSFAEKNNFQKEFEDKVKEKFTESNGVNFDKVKKNMTSFILKIQYNFIGL